MIPADAVAEWVTVCPRCRHTSPAGPVDDALEAGLRHRCPDHDDPRKDHRP